MAKLGMRTKIGLSIVLFLLLVAGAYMFLIGSFSTVSAPEWKALSGAASSTLPQQVRVAPDGQKEYRNEQYKFSLFYPQDLTVQEFDEGSGAHTFVFGDTAREKGFQIFVIPYAQEQIDRERFLADSPSGVMKEPFEVLIDGVKGNIFFGKNGIMGNTREVWFIRGGFLYEVTTYKDLDAWLAGIMQSWKWL
jgi:hypothetical protein